MALIAINKVLTRFPKMREWILNHKKMIGTVILVNIIYGLFIYVIPERVGLLLSTIWFYISFVLFSKTWKYHYNPFLLVALFVFCIASSIEILEVSPYIGRSTEVAYTELSFDLWAIGNINLMLAGLWLAILVSLGIAKELIYKPE